MRFAGDAIRNKGRMGRMGQPESKAKSGSIGDFRIARYTAPGVAPSMNEMPEENIASYTKLAEPEHREPEFRIPEFKA